MDFTQAAVDSSITHNRVAIHISEVGSFKACRRAWDWTSRARGNMEPKRLYAPFFFGRLVHECLELYYGIQQPWEYTLATFVEKERALLDEAGLTFEQDIFTFNEQVEIAAGMLAHYFLWEDNQTGPFALANMEWVTTEQEFRVPIIDPDTGAFHPAAYYEGKWDGILRSLETGKLYICEYKTAKAVEQRAMLLPNDEQAGNYLNAASTLFGEEVDGVLYTILGKKVPKRPAVLKSGLLSAASLDKQTLEWYLQCIEDHHGSDVSSAFISANYGTELLALAAQKNTYFQRHLVRRNAYARASAARDLWNVATEMTNPNVALYPSPGFHCSYCLVREPCIQQQNGGPVIEILEDAFRLRGEHAGSADVDTE